MDYLYNDVQLTDIRSVYTPELQAQYPYALLRIATASASTYTLSISDMPITIAESGGPTINSIFLQTHYKINGEWTAWAEYSYAINVWGFKWSNHDIYTTDGTLYLAASDPIPVSNPPAPDPFWMLMGWQAGRMIAGMRGKKAESGNTVSGVWVFNSGTLLFKNESGNYFAEDEVHTVNFTVNSMAYTSMTFLTANHAGVSWMIKYGDTIVYDQFEDFYDQANATVDFGSTPQEVSENLYKWLTANAVKQ